MGDSSWYIQNEPALVNDDPTQQPVDIETLSPAPIGKTPTKPVWWEKKSEIDVVIPATDYIKKNHNLYGHVQENFSPQFINSEAKNNYIVERKKDGPPYPATELQETVKEYDHKYVPHDKPMVFPEWYKRVEADCDVKPRGANLEHFESDDKKQAELAFWGTRARGCYTPYPKQEYKWPVQQEQYVSWQAPNQFPDWYDGCKSSGYVQGVDPPFSANRPDHVKPATEMQERGRERHGVLEKFENAQSHSEFLRSYGKNPFFVRGALEYEDKAKEKAAAFENFVVTPENKVVFSEDKPIRDSNDAILPGAYEWEGNGPSREYFTDKKFYWAVPDETTPVPKPAYEHFDVDRVKWKTDGEKYVLPEGMKVSSETMRVWGEKLGKSGDKATSWLQTFFDWLFHV